MQTAPAEANATEAVRIKEAAVVYGWLQDAPLLCISVRNATAVLRVEV